MFGSKEDALKYILDKNWEKASEFGDHVCYGAVINDSDFIWDQCTDVFGGDNFDPSTINVDGWNSCSWGNMAVLVHYGNKRPTQQRMLRDRVYMLAKHVTSK